jgi:hypothetical protein
MPYANVDNFREKGATSLKKNNLRTTEFCEKIGQK